MKNYFYFLFFILLSCQPNIKDGEVIDKRSEPESKTFYYVPVRVNNITIYSFMCLFDGEDWILTVKHIEQDGTIIVRDVYVDEDCYNSLNEGDEWHWDNNCSFNDENNSETQIIE